MSIQQAILFAAFQVNIGLLIAAAIIAAAIGKKP